MGAVVARVLKIMEYPFFSRLSIKKNRGQKEDNKKHYLEQYLELLGSKKELLEYCNINH